MNHIIVGKNVIWQKGMTVSDLLIELNQIQSLVGVLINGMYVSKSNFDKIKIPDKAMVEFIPWKEGMTVRELQSYHKEEEFVCAAVIDGILIPEAYFDETIIPEDSGVDFITFVGGG